MDIRKMTEAAILSAGFVVLSVILVATGMGYFGYIDFVVPVLITIIYLRCGLRYTILSSITSVLLIVFAIGDLSSAIFISQSMIFGILCAILLHRKQSIIDDLFYASLFCCLVMLIIDFSFSVLTGVSVVKQCNESLIYAKDLVSQYSDSYGVFTENKLQVMFYLLIISLPIGTVITTYIFSLLLGKKLKLLNEISIKKFLILKNFKSCGQFMSCSRKTILIGTLIIIVGNVLLSIPLINTSYYSKIFINSAMYVILFFLVQDSVGIFNKFSYSIFNSRVITFIVQLIIIISLINNFKITFSILIIFNLLINNYFAIKKVQIHLLKKYLKLQGGK